VIFSYSTVAPQVKAGRARLVAVTSAEPHPSFPGVPTMASVIPGLVVTNWYGFFVPKGTPTAVVQRLNRELNEIARTSKSVRELNDLDGHVSQPVTSEEFGNRVRTSYMTWKKLAADRKIVVD